MSRLLVRFLVRLVVHSSVLLLAGCAALPTDLPPRPAQLHPDIGRTVSALAQEAATLPAATTAEPWWQAFAIAELNRLEALAMQANPSLVVARARLEAANRAETLARLNSDVHYSTDANATRQRFSENGIFPPPIGGSTFSDFSLNQSLGYNLDVAGRNRDRVLAAGAQTRVARAQDNAVRLTLSAAIGDAYFSWAGIGEQRALASAIEQRHRKEYDLARKRFELDLTGIAPVHDARQKLDFDADRVGGLDYQSRAARYRLATLLGVDPDQASQFATPPLGGKRPPLPSSLPLDVLARRPDVAAKQAVVESAEAEAAATRDEFYPDIDLKAVIGLDSLDLGKLLRSGSIAFAVGPALHLPLFNTNTLQARLGIREADVAAAVGEYNYAIVEAARQVVDNYALNVSLDQRMTAQHQALAQMQQNRELADKRLDLGLARPFDALEAELGVLEQQLTISRLHASQLRARVAFATALGGETHGHKD